MPAAHLNYIMAQQRITELQRAAAQHRAAHAVRHRRRPDTNGGRVLLRRLHPHRAAAQPVGK